MKKITLLLMNVLLLILNVAQAQYYENTYAPVGNKNKPDREAWLQDAGFGMFIHFSYDSQLGIVISHSMVGASEDYLNRFIHDLPQTFDPYQFNAREVAKLARLAGMKYLVLTTKHHSGFCLWDTQTTDFNIMNTPYGKDLVAEYVSAVRDYGMVVGFYFSPEDFHFLHSQGQTIRRRGGDPLPKQVLKDYQDLTRAQCRELMTNYGPIDVLFFDGGDGGVQEVAKEVCWQIQPEVLITRGALSTPEQTLPGIASDQPWEACITMGTQWQYKPTNEDYKSGKRLIEILIETRAKGGSLLLNVGPKPDGKLPEEQEARLREIAAWNFINQEGLEKVRPWIITHEESIWFTRQKDEPVLYAFLTNQPEWPRGERRSFILRSVKATPATTVSVLGQSGELVEYMPEKDGKAYYKQTEEGLEISCVRAQRIYNDHKWPNPIVVKLTEIAPALVPPAVKTLGWQATEEGLKLEGELINKGDADQVKVGFMYREYEGFAENLKSTRWESSDLKDLAQPGAFEVKLDQLAPGKEYEFRAWVVHPKISLYGDIQRFRDSQP